MSKTKKLYLLILTSIYIIIFTLLSISPFCKTTWWLEVLTTWILIAIIGILFIKRIYLDYASYTLVFIAIIAHTIGGYYSFQNVPAGFWIQDIFGFDRNHYDRFGHFMFGTLTYPLLNLSYQKSRHSANTCSAIYQISLILALGALYELWECLCIVATETQTGLTYVGAQGDIWDAQYDLTACLLGSICATIAYFIANRKHNKRICYPPIS